MSDAFRPHGLYIACQVPLSMGFSRQESWSGLPFSSSGDLSNPGIEPVPPMFPALAGRFFTPEPRGKPWPRPLCVCAKLLQSCLTLCDPMDCSLPGSSVHRVLQARILEWVAVPSSRGSSQFRDQTRISYVSYIAGGFFTISTT